MSTYSETEFNLTSMKVRGFTLPIRKFDDVDHIFWSGTPDNMRERLQYLKEFEIINDDVFVCSYAKSGTNWIHEIVYMLVHGNSSYAPLFNMVEALDTDFMDKMQSPRVFVSHLPFRYLPKQLTEKGKIIYVVRNPKDVAVSLHCHLGNISYCDYNGSWVPSGSWFDHVLKWEKVPVDHPKISLLIVHFEDMKQNPKACVEKISDFLELKRDEDLISEIVTKCDFPNLHAEKIKNVPIVLKRLTKNLPHIFYRKGIVGDWKNWFTVAQNEHFDSIFNNRMKYSNLRFSFML